MDSGSLLKPTVFHPDQPRCDDPSVASGKLPKNNAADVTNLISKERDIALACRSLRHFREGIGPGSVLTSCAEDDIRAGDDGHSAYATHGHG